MAVSKLTEITEAHYSFYSNNKKYRYLGKTGEVILKLIHA